MAEKAIYFEGSRLRISKRQLKIRLIAILLVLIAAYSVGEIAVRIFDPQQIYNRHDPSHPDYPKEVEYDRDLGWSTVKNYKAEPYTKQGRHQIITITHNSKGYRLDHEVDENKPAIVMTGDSLVYGFWVDDKKVASAKLNAMLGDKYEVINLGVGGYGTDQGFLRFMRDGISHKPKFIFHGFFANDFSNIVSNYQYNVYKPVFKALDNGSLILTNVPVPISPDIEKSYPKKKEHSIAGFQRIMYSWSHLYILYDNKISILKEKVRNFFWPKKIEKKDYYTDYKDGEMWAVEKDYTDIMKYSFYLNGLILKEYNRIAKMNNSTFVLVLIADRISVDRQMQKATVEKYNNVDDKFFDYGKPYTLLENFAKSEGIRVINLYPLFKKEYQENHHDMYLDGDHHLNDYGHELMAREIYKYLSENGLIEKT